MPTTTAKKPKKNIKIVEKGSTRSGAKAIHGIHNDDHIVGIGNLRVIMCKHKGIWWAQGIEINYGASGKTMAQAKKNFEHGLSATIRLQLEAFDSIDKLLVYAPKAALKELTDIKKDFRFTQISVHQFENDSKEFELLPFSGIAYLDGSEAAA
jgi:hypothetical protein